MHTDGFTPYATEHVVTDLSKHAFTVREPRQTIIVIMGGRDIYNRKMRREMRTTFSQAWIEYQQHWRMTHLWIVANGRRRLVHRKA